MRFEGKRKITSESDHGHFRAVQHLLGVAVKVKYITTRVKADLTWDDGVRTVLT